MLNAIYDMFEKIVGGLLIRTLDLCIKKLSFFRQRLTKYNNDDGNVYKLNLLSPINLKGEDSSEEHFSDVYIESVYWGIMNNDAKNIGITGSYGVGKSSIIKTLVESKKDILPKHISISLASFEAKENLEDDKLSELISLSIVNQILYSQGKSAIPDSRFERIHFVERKKKFFLSLVILFFVYTILFLFFPSISNSLVIFDKWNNSNKYFAILFFILVFIFCYTSIGKLKNLKLSKLSLTNIEIEHKNSDVKELNTLNKFYDEILYFFQATKTQVMFIEDLDRFKNSISIFSALRELNHLLNQSEDIKAKVTFVYAVKDDVIENYKGKTKFFDLIIPLVPYINYSNSRDIFKNELVRVEPIFRDSFELLNFLNLISPYIEDTRTIYAIINDYIITREIFYKAIEGEMNKVYSLMEETDNRNKLLIEEQENFNLNVEKNGVVELRIKQLKLQEENKKELFDFIFNINSKILKKKFDLYENIGDLIKTVEIAINEGYFNKEAEVVKIFVNISKNKEELYVSAINHINDILLTKVNYEKIYNDYQLDREFYEKKWNDLKQIFLDFEKSYDNSRINSILIESSKRNRVLRRQIQLLSFVVYKNIYSLDYSLLLERKGVLYNIFYCKKDLIDTINKKIESELIELEKKIELAEKSLLKDENHLKKIFMSELAEKLNYHSSYLDNIVRYGGRYDDLLKVNNFEILFKNGKKEKIICQTNYQPKILPCSFGDLEDSLGLLYEDEICNIKNKKDKKYKEITTQIEELRKRKNNTVIKTLKELYEPANYKVFNQYIEGIVEQYYNVGENGFLESFKVLKLMIENGFIEENFISYLSHTYEGILNLSDQRFKRLFSNNEIDLTYNIENANILISDIGVSSLRRNTALNYSLIEYIYAKTDAFYSVHRNALMEMFRVCLAEDINTFFSDLERCSKFKKELIKDFIRTNIYNDLLLRGNLETQVALLEVFKHVDEDLLKVLQNDRKLKDFLSSNEFLLEKVDDRSFENILNTFYGEGKNKLSDCTNIRVKEKLVKLVNPCFFNLTITNISYVISQVGEVLDGYESFSLTNIFMSQGVYNMSIANYFRDTDKEFVKYIEAYISKLKEYDKGFTIKEDDKILLDYVINFEPYYLEYEDLSVILEHVMFEIEKFSMVEKHEISAVSMNIGCIIISNKVRSNWENVLSMLEWNLDNLVINFVCKNIDKLYNEPFDNKEGFVSDYIDFVYGIINSDNDNQDKCKFIDLIEFDISDVNKLGEIDLSNEKQQNLLGHFVDKGNLKLRKDVYEILNAENQVKLFMENEFDSEILDELSLDYVDYVKLVSKCLVENLGGSKMLCLVNYLLEYYLEDINYTEEGLTIILDILKYDKLIDLRQLDLERFIGKLLDLEEDIVASEELLLLALSSLSESLIAKFCDEKYIYLVTFISLISKVNDVNTFRTILRSIYIILIDKYSKDIQIDMLKCFVSFYASNKELINEDFEGQKGNFKVVILENEIELKTRVELILLIKEVLEEDVVIEILSNLDNNFEELRKGENFEIHYLEEYKMLLEGLKDILNIKSIEIIEDKEMSKILINYKKGDEFEGNIPLLI